MAATAIHFEDLSPSSSSSQGVVRIWVMIVVSIIVMKVNVRSKEIAACGIDTFAVVKVYC